MRSAQPPVPLSSHVPGFFVAFAACCMLAGSALAGATYTYDSLGRVISVRYDDGKQIIYKYDAAGNRTQHIVSATTVNRAPVAVPDAVTLTEDQSSVTLNPRTNDSDPDGNPLTLFSVSNGIYGTAALSGGSTTVTYTSTYKRTATDKLVYTINDGQQMETSGEITINLVNLPPVAVNDTVGTLKNTTKTFDPRANDTDPGGDVFTITAKSTPAHGTLSIGSGGTSLIYTPTTNYVGLDPFTYTVTDVDGGVSTATVNMAVTYGTTPPVAVNDTFGVTAGQTRTLDPRTNDSDDTGTITVTAKTNGAHGTVTIGTGGTSMSYAAQAGYSGNDTFTYTISDLDNLTATATVTMNVTNTNHPPVAVTDTAAYNGSWPYTGPFVRPAVSIDPRWNDTDPDGNTLTVTGKTNGTLGTVTQNGNVLTWTANDTYGEDSFSDSFTYTISDGNGGTATGTVNVDVTIWCANNGNAICP